MQGEGEGEPFEKVGSLAFWLRWESTCIGYDRGYGLGHGYGQGLGLAWLWPRP